jgi:inosose dehydratase
MHTVERGRLACGLVLCGPRELESELAEIRTAGYAAVELHPPHLDAYAADPTAGRSARAAIDAAGLTIACANLGVLRDGEYPETTLTRLAAAVALGVGQVFVLMGDAAAESWEDDLARMRHVCDVADADGIPVVLHHHAGTRVDGRAAIERYLDEVDRANAGLLFDTAHYALFEADLVDGVRRLAGRIDAVHVKDLTAPGAELMGDAVFDTLPAVRPLTPFYTDIGAGVLDLAGVARALAETGYAGPTTIEMETLRHPTFRVQAAVNAAAWVALETGSRA